MTTRYEWIVEEIDEHGDIVDTSAWDTAADALAQADLLRLSVPSGWSVDVGLTRNVGNDDEGLTGRSWAYLDAEERLPAAFTDGDADAPVPQRYVRELAAAIAARVRA
jgi:hypothetical protein